MNIIDESFVEKQKAKKSRAPKIILAIIILLVIVIIGIIVALAYIENSTLKVYIDGQVQTKVKDMLVSEGDTVYVPIRDISSYLGYQTYNGDYAEKSEEKNKCYIENENEIANFVLNSNKIYKLETQQSNADYQYFYSKKPVKSINGNLYISSDGMEKAFNVSFYQDAEKNRIYIYTMDYLVKNYETKVLDLGYKNLSEEFNNYKSIFEDRIVVEKDTKQVGVIDLQGNVIIEPKYTDIEYIPQTGDFFATSNAKVGIISKDGEMKVQILYDSLELMDMDAGIYLAEREDKYGIIDVKGNIKLYIENEEIGIDASKFEKNDIRNKYLLVDNLIPVKRNGLWGLVNKNGQQVVDFKYDSFGYIATSNKDALNLLVVPSYNVIITCKDKKYGVVNSSGNELFPTLADDIYMTVESGNKYYYINYLDKRYDVEKWLDSIDVKAVKNEEDTSTQNSTNNNTTNETTENQEQNTDETVNNEENQEQNTDETEGQE